MRKSTISLLVGLPGILMFTAIVARVREFIPTLGETLEKSIWELRVHEPTVDLLMSSLFMWVLVISVVLTLISIIGYLVFTD